MQESRHALTVGAFSLDPLTHRLSGAMGTVQLSPLASRFLQTLAAQPGTVVDRETLIERLWRGDWLVGDPALNRVVSETRRAVGDDPRNPALIQTVHRQGYRLVGADAVAADPAWTPPATNRTLWIKGGLWIAALIVIVIGAKIWMDTMIGVLWVANNPG